MCIIKNIEKNNNIYYKHLLWQQYSFKDFDTVSLAVTLYKEDQCNLK